MSFLQDDVLAAALDNIFGSGTPAMFYVALFTTTPDTDGTGGVEAAYTDYARFAVTNNSTEFPDASGSPPVKSNANDWDFGVAGSGPTTIHSVGFYDDPTSVLAADLWAVVDVTTGSLVINDGADVTVPAASLDLTGCA
jgi:hypothetical protein